MFIHFLSQLLFQFFFTDTLYLIKLRDPQRYILHNFYYNIFALLTLLTLNYEDSYVIVTSSNVR